MRKFQFIYHAFNIINKIIIIIINYENNTGSRKTKNQLYELEGEKQRDKI